MTTTAKMTRPPSLPASPNKAKILIGVPMYNGDCKITCVNGLINLCLSMYSSGIEFQREFFGNESLIPRARNRIANYLLQETDCTHLMFIDADIGFRPRDVDMLLRCNVDVVAGAYPMKTISYEAMHKAVKDGHPWEHLEELGALYAVNAQIKDIQTGQVDVHERNGAKYVEMREVSTGFMMLKRTALEAFVKHYEKEPGFRYLCNQEPCIGKTHHKIFHADADPLAIQNGELPEYLSEDYHFCRKFQMMGGKVHMCIDTVLTHMGSHVYHGDVGRLFAAEAPKVENGVPEPATHALDIEMVAPGS